MVDKQKEVEIDGMIFKIEKGIERPSSSKKPSMWKELLENMEVGDSVLLSIKSAKNLTSVTQSAWNRKSGYRVSYRRVNDEQARVWRIK